MTSELFALCVGANDPERLARFWSGVLLRATDGGVTLPPDDATGFRIRFLPFPEPKTLHNLIHFELTSDSLAEQERTVARALDLGARHIDVGQLPEEEHVVLADPDGNEFCVIEAGNKFLAGCGFLGALSCDGTPDVGHFWSAALGWPLVWDQDDETAIQSPHGGPKITWGGPPYMPRPEVDRLHLDLVPSAGTDQPAEVERLLSLGAAHTGAGHDEGSVAMTDPDGNAFCVLAPR